VLPQILQKAGVERPLLLGQSDGASIGILYAGTFPIPLSRSFWKRRMSSSKT